MSLGIYPHMSNVAHTYDSMNGFCCFQTQKLLGNHCSQSYQNNDKGYLLCVCMCQEMIQTIHRF